MRLSHVAIMLVLLCVSGCGQKAAAPEPVLTAEQQTAAAQAKIEEFFTAVSDKRMERDPSWAVNAGYFSGDKQDQLSRQLTPRTRDYTAKNFLALEREGLAQLGQLDLARGTPTQQKAAKLLKWAFDMDLANEPYLDYIDFPLEQLDGANVEFPRSLTVVSPVQNAKDADNYVARLQQIDDRMKESIADSANRAEHGIVVPAFILRTTIDQMKQFISTAPKDNPLVTTLAKKTGELKEFSAEQRAALLKQAEDTVTNEVYPTWQAAIAELNRQLPLATEDAGLWRFPKGAEIYQQQLKAYTTTNLTADEIHAIGLQEVARIEAEMDSLFKKIGLNSGSIVERVKKLETRTAYSKNDAGRSKMTKDIEGYLADALKRSAALFDLMPKTQVIAQAYPRFMWDTAPATYTEAPLDASRPAIFQFPLRDNELMSYDKRSLVYHETVPGHHFQLALIAENKDLPRFMQAGVFGSNSANVEGWGLYGERLADEAGWYEGDIEGRLGYLDSQLFRARRLVVDTGLHAKHWTRQQAIDYGIAPSEVDRYVVLPGQACSYMIGMLKIVELREKTRKALGDKFSIQQFHNVVLGAGVVPLTMLEQIVDDYIAGKK